MNNIKDVLKHEYANKPLGSFPLKLINYLVKKHDLSGSVLDVMCGRGEHLEAFKHNGLKPYGLDVSPDAANEFSDKEEKLFICDTGKDKFPFNDNFFDITFCKSGIEHVNPDHLISEMHRVTKPGGTIIIMTLDWWYTYRMHYIDHTHGYGTPWMKNSLRVILDTYGFVEIKVENIYYLEFTWKYPFLKIFCWMIRNFLPYPYIENFTNPIWKIIRFSNELQLYGVAKKKL